jgi:uncharacterized protein
MTEAFFVDSNIIMYAVGAEHAYRAPCLAALERIVREDLPAVVSSEIHQEILRRYLSIGLADQAVEVSQRLETVISTTLPVTLADVRRARQLAGGHPGLGARDLLHAAVMLENGLTRILSKDRHFDQVAEIERIDPHDFRAM